MITVCERKGYFNLTPAPPLDSVVQTKKPNTGTDHRGRHGSRRNAVARWV